MEKKAKMIDKNDAPVGYIAVQEIEKSDCCKGCAFYSCTHCGNERNCCSQERKDKQRVIFVKA